MVHHRYEGAIRRILHEYLALPGLSLTPSQMKRLLALDEDACQEVLAALVDTGYVIHRPADGRCVRPPEVELDAWRRAVHGVLSGTEDPVVTPTTATRANASTRSDALPAIEIRRVLCPVDLTEQSRDALTFAIGVARQFGASVTALHVIQSPGAPAAYDSAIAHLRQLVLAADTKATVDTVVAEGSVVGQIVACATRIDADLLVMVHRPRHTERLPLSSITQGVTLSAPCPVLLAPRDAARRAPSRLPFSSIVCAVDFSPASMRALQYATSLACRLHGDVVLLHVLAAQSRDAGPFPFDRGVTWRSLEARALRELRAAVPTSVRRRCAVAEEVRIGTPAREILCAASDSSANLIVMGSQSRTGFELLQLGSTTHHVMREAPCAVLTTRALEPRGTGRATRAADVETAAVPT